MRGSVQCCCLFWGQLTRLARTLRRKLNTRTQHTQHIQHIQHTQHTQANDDGIDDLAVVEAGSPPTGNVRMYVGTDGGWFIQG